MPNELMDGSRTLGGRDVSGKAIHDAATCPECEHPSPLKCSNHPPVLGEPGEVYICLSNPEQCRLIERCGIKEADQ